MASPDDVLITDELFSRPSRAPNLQAENEALHVLARQIADMPERILDSLSQVAVDLCQTETAGVSLIETASGGDFVFRWVSVAGALARYVGDSTPRSFSPSGICVDRNAPQLFRYPARYYTYLERVTPRVVECLVLPFMLGVRPIGTIWIVAHTRDRKFDREDARIMASLAGVTSAVFRVRRAAEDLAAARERAEVAGNLHNLLNETLFAIALKLDWCLEHVPQGEGVRAKLGEVQQDVGAMMARIREMVAERAGRASPRILSEKLERLASRIRDLAGLSVEIVQNGDETKLSERHVEILENAVQEGLVNIAKHAQATRATVTLTVDSTEARFEIADDGVGMGTDTAEPKAGLGSTRHFGLRQMRASIEAAGGRLEVGASAAGGFRLSGMLPMR